MVVLVTGANGQLGQALRSIAGNYPGIDFHFAGVDQADITNPKSLQAIFLQIRPDYCINAAAYTAVDKAESEPEKARAINVDGVRNLAETCRDFKTTLLHLSTDFVFDGQKRTPYQETDATNPQGVYAQTKLDGEKAVSGTFDQYFIVRASWVYSRFGHNFRNTMLRLAAERPLVQVVNDQIGSPTHAVDLAQALVSIILSAKPAYGIYHFSNAGATSWYGFAHEIFALGGCSVALHPIPTSAYPTPAKRPQYSVLDTSKIRQVFGMAIDDWKTALKRA